MATAANSHSACFARIRCEKKEGGVSPLLPPTPFRLLFSWRGGEADDPKAVFQRHDETSGGLQITAHRRKWRKGLEVKVQQLSSYPRQSAAPEQPAAQLFVQSLDSCILTLIGNHGRLTGKLRRNFLILG